MRKTKRSRRPIAIAALAVAVVAVAVAAMSAGPANAESCFWRDPGQHGPSRCFPNNVSDFHGVRFSDGSDMFATASSFQNKNWTLNEYVYSERNYQGQEQELEDETTGSLDPGINNHLGSYDAK